MGYTKEQEKFITYNGDNSLILSATAGSGKTHATVGRLNHMLKEGVDPSKIIFFSFTNDAVNELKSRIDNPDVKITTIHAFTFSMLAKMGQYKPVATFYDFISWYQKKYKPQSKRRNDPKNEDFTKKVESLWEDGTMISSKISAYKLQKADGIKEPIPDFFFEYQDFLKEEKKRDFCDLLIEAEQLSNTKAWRDIYVGMYDYVFVDEYQDTSTIQMKILLKLVAKQYHLIGDKHQSIYGFSGTSCRGVEKLLEKQRKVERLSLSINFRSKKNIVDYSNQFSTINAKAQDQKDGIVNNNILTEDEFWKMVNDDEPLTVLVRTNKIIKTLEKKALLRKAKIRYFNYITPDELEKIKKNDVHFGITKKVRGVLYSFKNKVDNLINFIEENQDANTFITTIHKSKGREFPRCIVVNSFNPIQLDTLPVRLPEKEKDNYTFIDRKGNLNQEALNVHYVAVTRPQNELYFMFVKN